MNEDNINSENTETNSQVPSGNSGLDTPNFAHLGAPRAYSKNEVYGVVTGTPKTAIQAPTKRPSYSFKLVKTHTFDSSPATYMLWGAILVIILISVAASLTQGILLVKDRFGGNKVAAETSTGQDMNIVLGGNVANNGTVAGQNQEIEPRGSDDGAATITEESLNFTPLYKILAPDQIEKLGVTAKGYYVADIKTGERIMAKDANKVFPIASVSKLMTAIVAYEKMDLQKVVVVSRDSYNAYGAQGELVPGEKIKLGDLMYPVLMESSNDGAEVIAESFGRVEFMAEMNKKAAALGMTDTYFEDPSGLNAKNVSTSEDLFKLLKYVKEKAPVLYDMTRVREFAILKHKWFNKNRFLNTDIFLGGKNGYIDESRWTTASIFEVTLAKGGKRQIGIVLLKSENREGDATKLIKFLEKNVMHTETGIF